MNAGAPVRFALVGCGSVAEAYSQQIRKLAAQGTARLTWLCGRREAARADATTRLKCRNYTTDYAALLRRDDVDAVCLLTPMPLHARHALAALAAGKHVLVEKPMATTLADARRLAAAARRSKGFLLPAPFILHSPTFRAVAAAVKAGAVGRVHSAQGLYGWAGPDWTPWFYEEGGGVLFDLGVYNLQALTALLGPVRRVSAVGGVAIKRRKVAGRWIAPKAADLMHVTLDFGNTVLATIVCGFTIQRTERPALELYGTTGTMQILGEVWAPAGYEVWRNAAGLWARYPEADPHWNWCDGPRRLVECVAAGRRPVAEVEQGVHLVEVMTAALRAARTGRAVPVRSRFGALPLKAPKAFAAHLVHDPSREDH